MRQAIPNEHPWQPQIMDDAGEETTIDLLEIFYLFWGHLKQIIVWLVIGGTIGLLYTWSTCLLSEPQYQATAQVYVVNDIADALEIHSDPTYDNMLVLDLANIQRLPTDESLIEDYKALLCCRPLLEDVIRELSLDMSTVALENMISISNRKDTHIVEIAVIDSDPQEAADIANELISQGEIYFQHFVGTKPPKVLENVEASITSNSEYAKNAALGGGVVVFLYCMFLFVRFVIDDTIVTPDNVVECFGVSPLATIPKSNLGSIRQPLQKAASKRENDEIK